jgi:hypothetical protein
MQHANAASLKRDLMQQIPDQHRVIKDAAMHPG